MKSMGKNVVVAFLFLAFFISSGFASENGPRGPNILGFQVGMNIPIK